MSAIDPRSLQLDELTQTAFRLGKLFGQEAERAESHERRIELFHLFDRCFTSVRLGIALQLRLNREAARPLPAERDDERETLLDREAAERDDVHERPERYDERDRDRETERVSLPILLRTLEGVCKDAEALPGPQPAELPTLRELLVRVKGEAPAGCTPAPALRSRLTGSTAPPRVLVRPRAPPKPALGPGRRATGPP